MTNYVAYNGFAMPINEGENNVLDKRRCKNINRVKEKRLYR
jgi:hypothetical protein